MNAAPAPAPSHSRSATGPAAAGSPPAPTLPHVVYRIDAGDRIFYVNEDWSHFARANGGDHRLEHPHILGTVIWDAIGDETTREVYQRLVAKVRQGRGVEFRFRCDSPQERRVFRLRLNPLPAGGVEFISENLSREPRSAATAAVTAVAATLVTLCSWCGRIKLPDATWEEIERAIERHGSFRQPQMPGLTHGMCETCFHDFTAILESETRPLGLTG